MFRRSIQSFVTNSSASYAPYHSCKHGRLISQSLHDIKQIRRHLKTNTNCKFLFDHGVIHPLLIRKESSMSGSSEPTKDKVSSYPRYIIKELVELDEVIDRILKDSPSYITYHYSLINNMTLTNDVIGTLSVKDDKDLSRIVLGFPDEKSGEVICVVLDVSCLLRDKTFNPKQNKELLSMTLEKVFSKDNLCKIGYSMPNGITALKNQLGIKTKNIIDMQIAYEVFTGDSRKASLSDIFTVCGIDSPDTKNDGIHRWDHELDISTFLAQDYSICQMFTSIFCHCINTFFEQFQKSQNLNISELDGLNFKQRLQIVQKATEARVSNLDINGPIQSNDTQLKFSKEVSDQIATKKIGTAKIQIYDDLDSVLNLIPFHYRDKLSPNSSLSQFSTENDDDNLARLRDIVMEVGRRPYGFYGKLDRDWICHDENFRLSLFDIETLSQPLLERFGPNNRAVLDGSLHRISCMRSKSGQIYSLTYRIGRAIVGQCNMIEDILYDVTKSVACKASILIMGFPGTGKTTIIRDIVNKLSSQMFNVIVVDTSNEICGDGLILHHSVGMARRMMVPYLDKQAQVLIEAVQNHTPDAIVCDEIGRLSEVLATKTVKERGVRCIGSAHGNLRSLVENSELNGLIGGVQEVTLGDEQARAYQTKYDKTEFSKLVKQRAGKPLFDVIVELNPNDFNEWTVVKDVGSAVDDILVGNKYSAEIRRREGNTEYYTKETVRC